MKVFFMMNSSCTTLALSIYVIYLLMVKVKKFLPTIILKQLTFSYQREYTSRIKIT